MTAAHTGLATADPLPRTRPRGSRVLLLVSLLSVLGLIAAGLGLAIDDRTITGVPAWLKPAKFAISIAIYCATLAWFLTLVDGHRRLVRTVAWVTGVALALELVLITIQVVRGTNSHFNTAVGIDSTIFSVMGGLVALVFLAALVVGALLVRQKALPAVLGTGIRGGVGVAALGMAAAVLMLVNTEYNPGGGHTVGAPDGGPGLWLTGWSTSNGDLRVAHFVGLHALQMLPLLAWLLRRYATALQTTTQIGLVRLATAASAALVILLAVQAERGLPLLRPDSTVIAAALLGVAVVVSIGTWLVVRDLRAGRGARA